MDEQTKRKMIKNYFKKFPAWAIWLIVIGLIVLIAGAQANAGVVIVGIVIMGIGGFGIYSGTKARPTDQQIDEWLEEDLKLTVKKAHDKLGIDESKIVGEPVQITGPRFWDMSNAKFLYRKGKDNIIRFSPLNVTTMLFGQDQLLAHNCVLDFATGNHLNEGTDEYFYKDVVSVSTKSESKSVSFLGKPLQMNAAETFALTTSGGTSISVMLRDPQLIEKMAGKKGGEIPTTRADKAIQSIRAMLREKKG